MCNARKCLSCLGRLGCWSPKGYSPAGHAKTATGLGDGNRGDAFRGTSVGSRSSSVVTTPIRRALESDDYRSASAINTQETGKAITQQAFGIRTKVLEVDAFLKTNDAAIEVLEVHPEVCFAAMNGAPLVHAKKTWAGQHQRRQLLAEAGLILPSDLGELGAKAPVDDILDAAAAAWTAMRVANGQARSLPEVPEEVAPGVFAAICGLVTHRAERGRLLRQHHGSQLGDPGKQRLR